jgi:crotonobetainyl-CoA:carnitine CoA-transferase CaiB-like acyl-CoA transferase
LQGVKVLDFSTLLPGPYATLLLAEAGAEVIKIEKPIGGDELRLGTPRWGGTSLQFAALNAGKRSIEIDLKDQQARACLWELIREADVLVEQFRPGVMARLGLGSDEVMKVNPALIYCSITGYAADGPSARVAGHDLTYMADTGLLSITGDANGEPTLPPVLIADIGAGTMPAVMNILLALLHRAQTGEGSRISVAIADNLFAWPYAAVPGGLALEQWPQAGTGRLNGGSPRYQIYRTKDHRHIAAAPLEDRFWQVFCNVIGLDARWRDDRADPTATRQAVQEIIARHNGDEWQARFAGQDACATLVRSLREAAQDPQFSRLFARVTRRGDAALAAVATPIDAQFRATSLAGAPDLGQDNALLQAR